MNGGITDEGHPPDFVEEFLGILKQSCCFLNRYPVFDAITLLVLEYFVVEALHVQKAVEIDNLDLNLLCKICTISSGPGERSAKRRETFVTPGHLTYYIDLVPYDLPRSRCSCVAIMQAFD